MANKINDLDKEAEKLIENYQKTYAYLINQLTRQIDKGLSEGHSRSILKEIQSELKRLDEDAYKWSQDMLPEYYYASLSSIDHNAKRLKSVSAIGNTDAVLHKKAIEEASKSLYEDLAANTKNMSDDAKKIIRTNGKAIIDRQTISGESQKTTKRDLKNALKRDGVTSFVDAGNKRWSIDKYASMAVRSKSRILHNTGTMNRLEEYREDYKTNENFDLIRISKHNSACWCAEYEGTVWSISGDSDKYPPKDDLPNSNFNTLHPNCRHVFLSHMPELRGEGEILSSNRTGKTVKELNKELYYSKK